MSVLVAAVAPSAFVPPLPITSPDGLKIVLPVEKPNCALEIRAESDVADAPPTEIKRFDSGTVQIERPLPEAENKRATGDLLVQLDKTWYAQGRPAIYRIGVPGDDPTKLSAPHMSIAIEPAFIDALVQAKSMMFWDDGIARERFDLAKLDRKQVDRWQACIASQATSPPAEIAAQTQYRLQAPLQALTPINKGSWITGDDYPSRAMHNEYQGTVAFTLEISVNGRVRDCGLTENNTPTIIPSVNDVPELNGATCRIITRRARFMPATDGSGRPLVSYWSGRVRWMLPYD